MSDPMGIIPVGENHEIVNAGRLPDGWPMDVEEDDREGWQVMSLEEAERILGEEGM